MNDPYFSTTLRDQIGDRHFMSQLNREYEFPVEVFRITEDGTRELIRVE